MFHVIIGTEMGKIFLRVSEFQFWVGIQWHTDDNYVRKNWAAVVDLELNFDHFLVVWICLKTKY